MRDKQGLKNKDRHDKNSVILTCDKNRDAADRHRSRKYRPAVDILGCGFVFTLNCVDNGRTDGKDETSTPFNFFKEIFVDDFSDKVRLVI